MNDAAYRSAPTAEDAVARIVEAERAKDILRFITCGSVDDGKSTLIGRLLYDAELILEDHLAQLTQESASRPSTEDGLDFSLLVDGLQAEREQGITIDVAYRFFETARRKFVVADTPGHEQYTRNMVTGASNAELALVLIDARKGVLTQTRRHTHICALLGIRHLVAVINKMDLVDYDQAIYAEIEAEMRDFAARVGIEALTVVPISALKGDNVAERSARMDWYDGPALMDFLETVEVAGTAGTSADADAPLRFPVQWVNRPDLDFRGFSGTLARGTARVGQRVTVARSGHEAGIARIVTFDGDLPSASAGDAVTLVLDREIDVSRGDMLVAAEVPPCHADQFQAHLVWMADAAMMPGRTYLLQIGTDRIPATVTSLKYRIDVNNLDHLAATKLGLNELGVANLAAERPVAFDAYADCRETGGFILIDRLSNATVAAGMIDHPLRRATNLSWQAFDVDVEARAAQKGQTPAILWFTGLSGSGKSTIANLVEKRLFAEGRHLYLLDGDNVRHGLNKDLGFTEADRVENIRRVAEVARLMAEAGLIVLVSFISPFRRERDMAREIAEEHRFIEIFVDTPIEVCAARDPKGLYKKAKAGQISNFTGIDSPYEAPETPEIRVDTTAVSPEDAAGLIVRILREGEPR